MVNQHSPKKKWSREKIIAQIKRLHEDGVALNSGSVRKTHSTLIGAANQYFKNWQTAIEAADLDYADIAVKVFDGPRKSWDKEKVVAEIKDLHRSGEDLSARNATLEHSRLYGAACWHHGNWKSALEAAGLDESKIRLRPEMIKWSKDLVIAGIKARKEAKLPLNSHAVEQDDWNLCHAGSRHFGSWAEALDAAGFDSKSIYKSRTKPWTKPEFVSEIKALHEKGVGLSMANMIRIDRQDLTGAGYALYGSWQQALEALGFDYAEIKEIKDWSPEEVIEVIQHLAEEGYQLNHGWAKEHHNGLTHAAYKYFGGWSQTLTAAGLNYREHARYWSTKAWLNDLNPDDVEALARPGKEQKTDPRST